MARKGSQQKNGYDTYTGNNKKGDADSRYGHSGAKRRAKSANMNIGAEELQDTDRVRTPLSEDVKVTPSGKISGRKRSKKSGKSQTAAQEGGYDAESLQHSDHNDSSNRVEDMREENPSHDCDNVSASGSGTIHHSFDGAAMDYAVHNVHISYVKVVERLKACGLSTLKNSSDWLDRHKPFFVTILNSILNVRDYVRRKCIESYPVVLMWLVHVGSILLLISMVWLDCALRGMDSFIRMGTTSFFAIVWCSSLSVISMIGMLKFLFLLVVASTIGFFFSLFIALVAVVLSGTVILWSCGSFWTTSAIVVLGGLAFSVNHQRSALLLTSVYALYCAWTYVGWLGVLLAFNLSYISSDALVYLLKRNLDKQRNTASEQMAGMQGQWDFGRDAHYSQSEVGSSADRSAGTASVSETEITSEGEVVRLLNCSDHYAAMGFSRYEHIDVSILKREYRKKAMLVHPDKNMGNDKAAEAFKKLQNAYEVLLDSLKRKTYDVELKREEMLNYFRRFQGTSQKNGRHGFFPDGFASSEVDSEDHVGEFRRIACKKCGNFHIWFQTKKSKSRARWCQDCKDFHPAKDGDGWVEQSSQPFLFGLMQKVEAPAAYVCADSKVYDATEWYICQGMRCPVNPHKPSFHVNTSVTRYSPAKGTSSSHKGDGMPYPNAEENMTEEEFFEWLQNAMQAGAFDNVGRGTSNETADARERSSPKNGSTSGGGVSSGKKKKKGKKNW